MEETNNIKMTMPWSEIIALGILGAMIVFHSSNAHPLLLGFILLYLVVRSAIMLFGQLHVWRHSLSYAQGVLLNDPLSVWGVYALNPLTWPAITIFVIYLGAAAYVAQVDPMLWPVSLMAISPHIIRYFLYNRILKFIGNPVVQEAANDEIKFMEEEQKRNIILQEELNKVMPEVLEAAKKRWKDEGVYLEELDERDESDESDQERQSETGAGD